jgi:integrase
MKKKFPKRHLKRQTGSVYERCGSFYLRYYTRVDGKAKQVSKFLHAKDAKYHSVDCDAVLDLRDDFMRRERKQQATPSHDGHIVAFWETKYLPFITEHKKPSTVNGYTQIWRQHLKAHFEGKTFAEYRAHHGTEFILSVTKKHSRTTLNHIRAVMSAIFSHAVNLGVVEQNLVKGAVKIIGKPKATPETGFYTLEEAENIISALVEHVDCQLVMALSCFLGLRPGEIQGLRWEDIDDQAIHIRRSVWQGRIGTTKTPESMASLPLIDAVRVPLELWRRKRGEPSEGWVFETHNGDPVDLRDWTKRRIKPVLEAKKIAWKGIYSGRRGAGTAAIDLTNGNIIAGQELLRHKNATTTLQFYKKVTGEGRKAALAAISKQLQLSDGQWIWLSQAATQAAHL